MCNCKKDKTKAFIALIAFVVAAAGIAAIIVAYVKKHSAFLDETLAYDDDMFYEEDDYYADELEDMSKLDDSSLEPATSSDEVVTTDSIEK